MWMLQLLCRALKVQGSIPVRIFEISSCSAYLALMFCYQPINRHYCNKPLWRANDDCLSFNLKVYISNIGGREGWFFSIMADMNQFRTM